MQTNDLTDTDLEQYRAHGCLIARGLLDQDTVARLRAEVDAIAGAEERPNVAYYYEGPANRRQLRRVERLSGASPLVNELFRSDAIAGRVAQLFGEAAVLFKDKLNMKLPGGDGFRAHVDGHFHWKDPSGVDHKGWLPYGTEFINAVIPIDRSTRANGCLQVASLQDTFEHIGREFDEILSRVVDRGPDVTREDEAKCELKYLETDPGDVIFFDWRCVHGSEPNGSDIPRRILYSTYNRLSEGDNMDRYYEDKRTSSEPLARKALG